MDIPWGSPESKKFITNVGLITSDGPHGPNIMACEWTHHISYEPGLMAICVNRDAATNDNIQHSKQFGVSIATPEQTVLCSLAGGSSGKAIQKIKALEELGFSFYPGEKIQAPLVKHAALNVECKLVHTYELGDHTMFIGEAVDVKVHEKEPVALHNGKYWKLTDSLLKPNEEERAHYKKTLGKHKK